MTVIVVVIVIVIIVVIISLLTILHCHRGDFGPAQLHGGVVVVIVVVIVIIVVIISLLTILHYQSGDFGAAQLHGGFLHGIASFRPRASRASYGSGGSFFLSFSLYIFCFRAAAPSETLCIWRFAFVCLDLSFGQRPRKGR